MYFDNMIISIGSKLLIFWIYCNGMYLFYMVGNNLCKFFCVVVRCVF